MLKISLRKKTKYPAKISDIEHIYNRGDSPLDEKRVRELLDNPFASGYKDNGRATCSKYVRTTLDYITGKNTSWYGVYGNAWDLPNHVINAGEHIKFGDVNPEELRAGDILFGINTATSTE